MVHGCISKNYTKDFSMVKTKIKNSCIFNAIQYLSQKRFWWSVQTPYESYYIGWDFNTYCDDREIGIEEGVYEMLEETRRSHATLYVYDGSEWTPLLPILEQLLYGKTNN